MLENSTAKTFQSMSQGQINRQKQLIRKSAVCAWAQQTDWGSTQSWIGHKETLITRLQGGEWASHSKPPSTVTSGDRRTKDCYKQSLISKVIITGPLRVDSPCSIGSKPKHSDITCWFEVQPVWECMACRVGTWVLKCVTFLVSHNLEI